MNPTSTAPRPDHATNSADSAPRVTVPADIDTPDRIAWGLSFRQLAILAAGMTPLWLAYSRFGPLLPSLAWVAIGIGVSAVTVTAALGRRDGLPLDAWLRHGLTMRTGPRVLAPGVPGRSLVATAPARPVVPAPLRTGAVTLAPDGALRVEGAARAVIACGTTGISLRTGTEQAGLLDGLGQWFNALTGPTQIVVATTRHDLSPHVEAVLNAAGRRTCTAVRAAAQDHAAFLRELDADRQPLHRQVLVVQSAGPGVETTTRTLSGLGITATPLDAPAVTAALAAAVDPYDPPVPGPRAAPGTPVTTRSETGRIESVGEMP